MTPDQLDGLIVKSKGLAPYIIGLFAFGLGIGAFKLGADYHAQFYLPSLLMAWAGAGLCVSALGALIGWHLFQQPPWFQIGQPPKKMAAPAPQRARRK